MDCESPHPARASSLRWGGVSAQRKGGGGAWRWVRQAPPAVVGYSGRESENSWVSLPPLRESRLSSSRGVLCLRGATSSLTTPPAASDEAVLLLHHLPCCAAKLQHLYSPSSTDLSSPPPPPGVDCCLFPPSADLVPRSSNVGALALCLFHRHRGQ